MDLLGRHKFAEVEGHESRTVVRVDDLRFDRRGQSHDGREFRDERCEGRRGLLTTCTMSRVHTTKTAASVDGAAVDRVSVQVARDQI